MSIPAVHLRSLDLIRSFVAVGRRMSITLAAEDLFITQSAVSRQIRALEDALGVRLLRRGHRCIALTPAGEQLFLVADAAVRQLQTAMGSIKAVGNRRRVTVSAATGFAGLWLLPRVGKFRAQHPNIDLRISVTARMVNLRTEDVDLAVRYCTAAGAPRSAIRLFGESLAPVSHPSVRRLPLERPEQLADHVLLEFEDTRRDHLRWANWLGAMGWTGAQPKGVVRFNQYDQVIRAALEGQGIALGRIELLESMLHEGTLVALAQPMVSASGYAHWLIQETEKPRKEVLDVVAWIRSQVASKGSR